MRISGILSHTIGPGHVLSVTPAPLFVQTESPVTAPTPSEPVEVPNAPIDSDDEENDDPMFEF
jgi:hypothetical protein